MKLTMIIAFMLVACECALAEQRVSLTKPYPQFYEGAPADRISVQYAVEHIAKQAGYRYDWKTSARNADSQRRERIQIEFEDIPSEEGMKRVLTPFGLTYMIRDKLR